MRSIYAFRDFLQTWQGTALTGIAILGTLYYGPRKMLETWDWYWERYRDNEVLFMISRRKTIPRPRGTFGYLGKHPPPPPQTMELPFHSKEIADYLGRTGWLRFVRYSRQPGVIELYWSGVLAGGSCANTAEPSRPREARSG